MTDIYIHKTWTGLMDYGLSTMEHGLWTMDCGLFLGGTGGI